MKKLLLAFAFFLFKLTPRVPFAESFASAETSRSIPYLQHPDRKSQQRVKKISIVGEKSFAGILTTKGYSFRLTSGQYDIENLESYVFKKKYATKPRVTGAVHRSEMPLEFLGLPTNHERKFIYGDSISLYWQVNHKTVGPPFRFTIQTMFGDVLFDTLTNKARIKLTIRPHLQNDNAVVLEVRAGDHESADELVRKLSDTEKHSVTDLLAQIPPTENRILKTVLFDILELHYDVLYQFHEGKINREELSPDLQNFYNLTLKMKSNPGGELEKR